MTSDILMAEITRGGVVESTHLGSCTLPKQCRPPSPRWRWRCDRSSYKRSWFSQLPCLSVFFLSFFSSRGGARESHAKAAQHSSKVEPRVKQARQRRADDDIEEDVASQTDVWESRAVQLLLPVRGCASARARARAHRSHANAMPSPSGNRSPSRQPAPRARRNIAARSRRRRR